MRKTSDVVKQRIKEDGGLLMQAITLKYLEEGDKEGLIEELTEKFEGVLDSLVIDRSEDPNSIDTGRRLAKMYINELMSGRYTASPSQPLLLNELIILQMKSMRVCLWYVAN